MKKAFQLCEFTFLRIARWRLLPDWFKSAFYFL